MADRFMRFLLARLRFAVTNMPALPMLAFLLVVAAALVHLFLLPGREAAIEESERRLASLERSARRALIERMGLNHVPVINTGASLGTVEEIILQADGKSVLNSKQDREGIVFKQVDGGMTFKAISNKYLLGEK